MSLITAQEALALPGARLSESDREAAESFLRRLDRYVRDNANYAGCDMPILVNEVNGPILACVGRACLKAGWSWQVQQRQVPSGIIGGAPIMTTVLALRPKEEAYAAAEGEASAEGGPRESVAAVVGERFPRFVDGVLALQPFLATLFRTPILTSVMAAQGRATLALVPDDKVERVTDVALRFCERFSKVFTSLADDLDMADLAALAQFLVERFASLGIDVVQGQAVDPATLEKISRGGAS